MNFAIRAQGTIGEGELVRGDYDADDREICVYKDWTREEIQAVVDEECRNQYEIRRRASFTEILDDFDTLKE